MKHKKILYVVCALFAISCGVFMFVYGEMDDSPGGQLLGLLLAIAGIGIIIKKVKG